MTLTELLHDVQAFGSVLGIAHEAMSYPRETEVIFRKSALKSASPV